MQQLTADQAEPEFEVRKLYLGSTFRGDEFDN